MSWNMTGLDPIYGQVFLYLEEYQNLQGRLPWNHIYLLSCLMQLWMPVNNTLSPLERSYYNYRNRLITPAFIVLLDRLVDASKQLLDSLLALYILFAWGKWSWLQIPEKIDRWKPWWTTCNEVISWTKHRFDPAIWISLCLCFQEWGRLRAQHFRTFLCSAISLLDSPITPKPPFSRHALHESIYLSLLARG